MICSIHFMKYIVFFLCCIFCEGLNLINFQNYFHKPNPSVMSMLFSKDHKPLPATSNLNPKNDMLQKMYNKTLPHYLTNQKKYDKHSFLRPNYN